MRFFSTGRNDKLARNMSRDNRQYDKAKEMIAKKGKTLPDT